MACCCRIATALKFQFDKSYLNLSAPRDWKYNCITLNKKKP